MGCSGGELVKFYGAVSCSVIEFVATVVIIYSVSHLPRTIESGCENGL